MRVVLLALIAARVATAQGTDSLPAFDRPNGSLMRAGTLTYELSVRRPNGSVVSLGQRIVTVTDTPLGGAPSWLVAESRRGTMLETSDSVSASRGDLAPAHWSATIGKAQFGASFTRDSMFGAIESYQGRASFGVAVPANALLSAGFTERLIEMLPLRDGYRSAATLVLVDGPVPRMVSAEILVDGSERIPVGSRSVDCWRVVIRAGTIEERLWVTRDGARVARTEQATSTGLVTATLLP